MHQRLLILVCFISVLLQVLNTVQSAAITKDSSTSGYSEISEQPTIDGNDEGPSESSEESTESSESDESVDLPNFYPAHDPPPPPPHHHHHHHPHPHPHPHPHHHHHHHHHPHHHGHDYGKHVMFKGNFWAKQLAK
ncbi:hypothetical protein KIN20_006039 [Parelaphostrongylus tenuis]|uniref:Uncharacterized protein n=1 Tax=Parelaphostrongylus tenuis TaxID=148309 RepID=A0AAD5M191_PARTN|nr:hypothetical protein KIN20_006039 [Parelaphostrongylus tenuis]